MQLNSLRARIGTSLRVTGTGHDKLVIVALALIVLIALILRVDAAFHPQIPPGTDAKSYARLAEALYQSGHYGTPTMRNPADWSPGVPLFVTAIYYITGGVHVGVARLGIALMGTVTVLLIYVLGARFASGLIPSNQTVKSLSSKQLGAIGGLVAALGAAIYPPFIEYTRQFMNEPLAAFLLISAILLFFAAYDHQKLLLWLASGMLFGLTALSRPEYLTFAVLLVPVIFVIGARKVNWKRGVIASLVWAVAFVGVIAPWTWHNYQTLDKFVPVTTGGGKALFVATYFPGQGRQVPTKHALLERYPQWRLESFRDRHAVYSDEIAATPMRGLLDRIANNYPGLDRDQALGRAGKDNFRRYFSEDPLGYMWMLVTKAKNIWERGSGTAMDPQIMRWLQIGIGLLAIIGAVLMLLRRRWEVLLPIILIGGITLAGAFLLAVPRRNLPLMPLVLALASVTITWAIFKFDLYRKQRTQKQLTFESKSSTLPLVNEPTHTIN